MNVRKPEQAGRLTQPFKSAACKSNQKRRAIVFHEKNGRRHAHCVWSRIDGERLRAVLARVAGNSRSFDTKAAAARLRDSNEQHQLVEQHLGERRALHQDWLQSRFSQAFKTALSPTHARNWCYHPMICLSAKPNSSKTPR